MLMLAIIVLFGTLFVNTANTCSNSEYYADTHCVLTPEEIEGPYYIPYHLLRKDVREAKSGLKLELKFTVNDEKCNPLSNVTVDIWHCDSLGIYSGYTKIDAGQPPTMGNTAGGHVTPTDNTTFLRGIQISDTKGVVEFVTNFPGWYTGRTIHIHIEVFKSGNLTHTGQIYLPETLSAKVAQLQPYSEHKTSRLHNDNDHVFLEQSGSQTILVPQQIDEHNIETGLKAEMILVVKS